VNVELGFVIIRLVSGSRTQQRPVLAKSTVSCQHFSAKEMIAAATPQGVD
jgi:hypothetical protein